MTPCRALVISHFFPSVDGLSTIFCVNTKLIQRLTRMIKPLSPWMGVCRSCATVAYTPHFYNVTVVKDRSIYMLGCGCGRVVSINRLIN